ncbi:hypothetical protein HMPREF1142_0661 [Peptostreptococcaceae bacterium AS15]|nr:hypothetical protein HMPREF1142_0661 [Peptostreptococcaceae bacterium AS15]
MVNLERFGSFGTEHLKKRNRVDFLIISKLDIAQHFLLKPLQISLQRKVI